MARASSSVMKRWPSSRAMSITQSGVTARPCVLSGGGGPAAPNRGGIASGMAGGRASCHGVDCS